MIPTLRVFETEKAALAADKALAEGNFNKRRVLPEPSSKPKAKGKAADGEGDGGAAAPTVDVEAEIARAMEDGLVQRHQVAFCRMHLEARRSIVAVAAAFGYATEAEEILEANGAIDAERPPKQNRDDPSPLSDALGLPVLVADDTPSSTLADTNWTLSSKFGMKLLSDKAAPLSSAVGMKTLTDRKGPSKVNLSHNAAPLSSALGMKTVIDRKKQRKVGLIDNAAPLSNALGIPVLTKKQ